MNENIVQRIREYCVTHDLLERGDRVAVACSGGADSVFLTRVLLELAGQWELTLALVHVNHGIRGGEADRDERFCRDFAAACGLRFAAYHGDVPQLARERGLSCEEAGRVFRYECLEGYCSENGFQKIAVAHHENDQAETVLFRMLRGSSLRGLGGMRPIRGRVIRPLLSVGREEIIRSLRMWGQDWREDSTNADMAYSRNRIRNGLLPRMQEDISPASVRHLAGQAEQMQELYDYIAEQTEQYYSELVREYSGRRRQEIRCDMFLKLPAVLRRELAFRMMERCAGSRRDLTRRHLDSLCRLAESDTGSRIDLPGGMTAGRDYDLLWVESVTKVARATAASLLASGHLSDGHHEYAAKRSTNVSVRSTESHVFHEGVCAAEGGMSGSEKGEQIRLGEQIHLGDDSAEAECISLEGILQGGAQEVFLRNFSGEKERIFLKVVPIENVLKEKDGKLPKNNCTKCFDYDKINPDGFIASCCRNLGCTKNVCDNYDKINPDEDAAPVFRHPQEGDYFLLDEAGHRKKVSRYFIDRHVAREKRRELWVLALGHHVIWIPELGRVSVGSYVTENTKMVLYAVKTAEAKEENHMDETIQVLYSEESVKKRVTELAEQINRDYQGKTLHLICILKGSVFFCCELMKRLMVPVTLDFMTVSSYGNSTDSGSLIIKKDIDESITGKECLIVEDIMDTGNTLSLLKENLLQRKPASLRLCTLLDKPERREVAVEADYVGFVIPDEFVVGYGMDYAQKYRNLPYIGILGLNEE